MINVTKAYLPPFEEYNQYLKGIWDRGRLTNHGTLTLQLENQLKEYLGVRHLQIVASGTVALQIAIKCLDLTGEIITTPFSHVATTTSIIWGNCQPVFVDIEDKTFCMDASKIEAAITSKTTAILATHLYGYPCDLQKIKSIAQKYNLRVIYDGSHAFGVKVNNQSIFNYGDVSTISFHATKLFHTIEGGAIITNDDATTEKCFLLKSFGHQGDTHYYAGINGKNSEFHAAMGLCNLPRVANFIQKRKEISELYKYLLSSLPLEFPRQPEDIEYNYAYFPVLFATEDQMLTVKDKLARNGINPRRYFYPSLNKLPYLFGTDCPIAEDVCRRILCLPLYQELAYEHVKTIADLITQYYV